MRKVSEYQLVTAVNSEPDRRVGVVSRDGAGVFLRGHVVEVGPGTPTRRGAARMRRSVDVADAARATVVSSTTVPPLQWIRIESRHACHGSQAVRRREPRRPGSVPRPSPAPLVFQWLWNHGPSCDGAADRHLRGRFPDVTVHTGATFRANAAVHAGTIESCSGRDATDSGPGPVLGKGGPSHHQG